MSKQQSIITNFNAAYGTIILLPNSESKTAGGMEIPVADAELPSGKVVAVGSVPKEFRSHGLTIGSTAYYARVTSSQIPLEVNGRIEKCKAILWSDLRGWAPAADGPQAGSTQRNVFQRLKYWLYAVGGVFAAGFVVGHITYPFVSFVSGIKSWFATKKGRSVGAGGTDSEQG